jgi:alpha-galactosidase
MNSFLDNYADFTRHNDPDMLEVGNGNLTVEDTRTHSGLWALMKAPLLIGTDITNLSQANIDILQNKALDCVQPRPGVREPSYSLQMGS